MKRTLAHKQFDRLEHRILREKIIFERTLYSKQNYADDCS